jgi:protein tyrosine phosphatase (PTP) superfamily phosphohydrolase (DUF442 family)
MFSTQELAMTRLLFGLLLATLLTTAPGCRNANRRPATPIAPNVPGATFVPPSPTPAGQIPPGALQQNQLPPGAILVPPGGMPPGSATPGATFPGGTGNPPPPTPPSLSVPGSGAVPSPSAPTQAQWRPTPGQGVQPVEARDTPPRIQLAAPEPLAGDTRLYPPDGNEQRQTAEPPILREKKARTTLPAGIPRFAKATTDVYSGLRPSIDDGLDWLAANGFKTVVHLRAPGEANDADRAQVEKLGLRYASIEVSRQTLAKETVDEFARAVGDVAGRPMFVYDQDGSLAGPLWYLYFRTAENQSDEVARIRANTLGLREDRDGPHRLMWLAVQKYLESTR